MAQSGNDCNNGARNAVEVEGASDNVDGGEETRVGPENPGIAVSTNTNLAMRLQKHERPARSNHCVGKWRHNAYYGPGTFATSNGKILSSQSKVPLTLGFSAFRKARRMRRQMMTREEYDRLRSMVPAIATQPKVSKVQVIEEAIKYIDQLHLALLQRLRSRTQPSFPEGEPSSIPTEPRQLRDLVHEMLSSRTTNAFLSHLQRERSKRLPSFMEKADRMAKRRKQ